MTMLCCIVLGMGVPTTANYCIMASTCAPILITLGVPKVAAHFFVFYFGIVADITPPVALAAYAGSAIAKSNPMKTGVNATKLAIAAFIVPYMFAMNPSMLLMDQGVLAAIQVIITSFLGIFGVSSALEGYIVARAPWWQRILLDAGGLSLIDPTWQTDLMVSPSSRLWSSFRSLPARMAETRPRFRDAVSKKQPFPKEMAVFLFWLHRIFILIGYDI